MLFGGKRMESSLAQPLQNLNYDLIKQHYQIMLAISHSLKRNSKPGNKQNGDGEKPKQKTCLMRLFFWFTSFSILLFGGACAVYIYISDQTTVQIISMCFTIPAIIIYLIFSYMLAQSVKEVVQLYILMDNALILLIFALVGWNGLTVIISPYIEGLVIVSLVLDSISLFFFVGVFRILIVRYDWQKHQVILSKIFIIASSMIFIGITCAFMITQAEQLSAISDKYANQVKDFVLFYTIALFTLFFELYNKISSIDGTSQHEYHYLGDQDSEKTSEEEKDEKKKDEKIQNANMETNVKIMT